MRLMIAAISCVIAFAAYAAFALSVDNRLTEDDIEAIKTLGIERDCEEIGGKFDKEIACLKSVQHAVQSIGSTECASKSDLIEPAEFLERNHGCCFDRARFIEKAARYFGFQTRHVFLIAPSHGFSITNALPLGQNSHATSEVLTSRGWLGVDSNEPFILLNADANPMTYREAVSSEQGLRIMEPKEFFSQGLDIVYGLYSRHGFFHGKNLPGPEFVLSELMHNF
ncbi:transglutaminase domain-containing protein [Amorphus sp. MBR-141]